MHPMYDRHPDDDDEFSFEEGDLLDRASEYAEEGDYEAAYMLIQQAIREDRSNTEAWWALAHLARSDEERNTAIRRVLTLEPGHPHAIHMRDQIRAGTLPSLNPQMDARKRKQPAYSRGENVPLRDYLVPAAFTFLAYNAFYILGLILNIHFLRQARQMEELSGQQQPNKGCLQALLLVYVVAPVTLIGFAILMAILLA